MAKIKEARIIFAEHVIVPRKEAQRIWLQRSLVPLFDDRLIIDYPSPIPEDEQRRLAVMQSAPHNYTVNDWRREADFPEDPNGDVYRVPANLFDVPSGSDKAITVASSQKTIVKVLSSDDIDAVVNEVDSEQLTAEIDPEMVRLVATWGQDVLDSLGLEDLPEFNPNHSRVVNFLREHSATQITGISDVTRQAIRDALAAGVDEGEGNADLRRRVRDVFADAGSRRARNIAKTEVNTASNWSITEAYQQSGVVSKRQWVAARRNTRSSHLALDGQERAINALFTIPAGEANAGATARDPGGFGIAEEDINCECTTIAVINDPITEEEQLEAIWKTFEADKAPWERRVERAAQRGFATQESNVLAAFDRVTS